MEIRWSPQAEDSYIKTLDYSLEHFGRFAAIELTHKVDAAVEKIKKHPSAWPLVSFINDTPDRTYRYITLKGPLQLVYREGDDFCNILAVWNTHMSPTKLKKIVSQS